MPEAGDPRLGGWLPSGGGRQLVLDAVIIGGGPAGATAGRLLAQWGRSVEILAAPDHRPSLAECLPPSNRKVFQFLGIAEEIEGAGFFRTRGNTVWWERAGRRIEPYPDGWGYQVVRRDFDRLLLDLAGRAGAGIRFGKAFAVDGPDGPQVEFLQEGEGSRLAIPARFVVDCSGRAGVLARFLGLREEHTRVVALCAVLRNEANLGLPDESHTLVESYAGGWAWSVPVSPSVRHVAFMIHREERPADYFEEMARTVAFREIFRDAAVEGVPWGRDASTYSASRYCGPGFVLAGDAGSFIDPLSSFGVRKAMVSGWAGAVVANTWLGNPGMRQAALEFFEHRERQVCASYRELSASWYADEPPEATPAEGEELRRALEDLRERPSIALRRAPGVRVEKRPGIEGNLVVMRDVLVAEGLPDALDFVDSVNLPRLAELAELHSQVPDVYEAYNRLCPPVALPAFLKALATLVAKSVLV